MRGEVNIEFHTEHNLEIRWINTTFQDLLRRGAKYAIESLEAKKKKHRIKPEKEKIWITIQDVSKSNKTLDAQRGKSWQKASQ